VKGYQVIMWQAILSIVIAHTIFWFKGNSKILFGLDWSPFQWWLTVSLLTDYLTIYAWWMMIEKTNVWKAGAYWGLIAVLVDLSLNCIYFGVNIKGIIALMLIAIAGILIH